MPWSRWPPGVCVVAAVTLLMTVAASGRALLPGLMTHMGPVSAGVRGPAPGGFRVTGTVGPLAPGLSYGLDLRLSNRHTFALGIRTLAVTLAVDRDHAAAGCVGAQNFAIAPLPPSAFPITLGPRRSRRLSQLGVRRLPVVGMRALATNQDACKGARLTLKFVGRARRLPR